MNAHKSLGGVTANIFNLSLEGHNIQKRQPLGKEDEALGAALKPLVFRVDETTPRVVQSVLLERGWDQFDEQQQDVEDWNLYWRASSFRMVEHVNVKPWQRLNHHPGTTTLTRKDCLAKHLAYMRRLYGESLYEFTPRTFIIPNDYTKFVAEYFKEKQVLGTKPSYWICKPAELSRGRGIVIFSDIRDLNFNGTYVVQKYICNPLLVGRYKCDLRIYVCVTGFKPLTIYVYKEGLVRFATEKFDLQNLQDSYAHLTNSSINKSGASYKKIKEVVGQGCKWTLSRFFSYLRNGDVDDLLLWQKIKHMVILTVLAVAPSVPVAYNCFELFGFDILIDENLKPWLLEVNYSPALSLDCSTDVSVKRSLVHDVIELIHLNGLRREDKKCNRASPGSPRNKQLELCTIPASPPYVSLIRFTNRTCSKTNPVVQRVVNVYPKHTRTSQLREMINKQRVFLTREGAKSKPKLRACHTTRKAFSPYTPVAQSQPHRMKGPVGILPEAGYAPDDHVGNFVLIFPFNEATFGASRNGLNVKRIIQELQKLMNK
ncbi:putative tubulin polyglutamylase TTLL2 isoform X2 [Peromyscus maniculatus bairdii]|uniref:Tubulin tyrosine ligase-like family, member 2 n=2 Tax=Peromyscus maniculatus bairdii TaxID=230844 RepID=A0A6J0DAC8_PERMB|nr:probable tubulin polyglutamylase TTLL2 isoform X2 [Peromyscus maniculatus bairdii]